MDYKNNLIKIKSNNINVDFIKRVLLDTKSLYINLITFSESTEMLFMEYLLDLGMNIIKKLWDTLDLKINSKNH